MLYRFGVFSIFFLLSNQSYAVSPVPAPLFSNFTKNYDLTNKQNLTLRQKTQAGTKLAEEEAILDSEPDFWAGLSPKLTDSQKNKIIEFNKLNDQERHHMGAIGGPVFQQQEQSNRLEDIKSDFMNTYLNDQVLNGWLVPTLKKANPRIENLEKNVQKLGDIGGDNKPPATPPATPVVTSTPASEPTPTPEDVEWQVETGTRFDLLRQKGRGWFNCDLFNSEAKVDVSGFRRVNYSLNVHKEIVLTKDTSIPFHVVRAALSATSEGQVGEVNTRLSENLNFNYANEFKTHNNSFIFNYSVKF
jgi:hypothetical protein